MENVIVTIGHPQYGYKKIIKEIPKNVNQILLHYLEEVAPKYEGVHIQNNIAMCKRVLDGEPSPVKMKRLERYAYTATAFLLAVYTLPHHAHAASGVIGTDRLHGLVNGIWITLLQIAGIICVPIIAWAGYTLLFAGASSEKRGKAKTILVNLIVGLAVIAGAPWLGSQVVNAAVKYLGA